MRPAHIPWPPVLHLFVVHDAEITFSGFVTRVSSAGFLPACLFVLEEGGSRGGQRNEYSQSP